MSDEGEYQSRATGSDISSVANSPLPPVILDSSSSDNDLQQAQRIARKHFVKENNKKRVKTTRARAASTPPGPRGKREHRNGGADDDDVEDDGVFVYRRSQILTGKQWAEKVERERREREEAEQAEGRTRRALADSDGVFAPSQRQHLLRRVREVTGCEQEEAYLAFGEALCRCQQRQPTAVIKRTCQVVMENLQKRVNEKLAQAVESNRQSIKLKRGTNSNTKQGEGNTGEEKAVKTKGVTRRGEGGGGGGCG